MMKLKSPCCRAKTEQGARGLRRCCKCGGLFNPDEIASGRVEGGTHHNDPSRRMILAEEPDASHPIIGYRPGLRGGL